MRSTLISLALVLTAATTIAQQSSPPLYQDVVEHFFQKYEPHKGIDINFVLKPDGWYLRENDMNRYDINENAFQEYTAQYPFWSTTTGKYKKLTGFPAAKGDKEQLYHFWQRSDIAWYDFNRSLYYGYNGWDADVIAALQRRPDLSDTLHEALARAYSRYASRYLWYVQGGQWLGGDTLQRRHGLLGAVPAAAADSAALYIRKAVSEYRIIAAHNPAYHTMVGTIALKLCNEPMHGWSSLEMAGYPGLAKAFIRETVLDSVQLLLNKNMLASCPPNAILLTSGDNPTFQSWYVQETMGCRKDITIVNLDLLGVPRYVAWLAKSHPGLITLPASIYGGGHYNYTYPVTAVAPAKPVVADAATFLSALPTRRYKQEGDDSSHYHLDSLYIPTSPAAAVWKDAPYRPEQNLPIAPGEYYLIDQLVMADIIQHNIAQRPICFESKHAMFNDASFAHTGLCYRLIAQGSETEPHTKAMRSRLSTWLSNTAVPVRLHTYPDLPEQVYLANLMNLWLEIAEQEHSQGNTAQRDKALDRIVALVEAAPAQDFYALPNGAVWLLDHHLRPNTAKAWLERYLAAFIAAEKNRSNVLLLPSERDAAAAYVGIRGMFQAEGIDTERLDGIMGK